MEVNPSLTDKAKHDLLLVRKVLDSGDRKAYAELMKTYADQVYATMFKMTGDVLDAEDLTLEAFSKAFEKLQQYTPDFAFSTWLFRIAKNNCIDHLRRKKKEESNAGTTEGADLIDHEATTEIPCQLPGPEQLLINRQETILLRKIVQGLKPHYKAIIELHYFKELSCEEIAEQLQLPESTVKVRLFRARELLYNILVKK
ncbi:MAG: sigma-70 family RNA polymerase sigma factor [Bacteroidetes bacterium]|nr:sigma-70 family RNA polymerase sigma factor [Bacteroidota bacterium]